MAYNLEHVGPEEHTDLYADPGEEEDAPRSGGLLRVAIALLVMGVFAGGLWFAYTQGMRHAGGSALSADVPLIRADTAPFKVKPENPGGMQIPDRDMLIYGQQRPQVEHLLPPPEEPMARPTPPPPLLPTPSPPRAETASVAPSPPSLPNPLPAQMQTATTTTAAAPGPAPAKRSAPVAGAATPSDPIAEEIGRLETASAVRQPQPNPANMALGSAGGFRLQLGAVRTESAARGQWERLKRTNPDLLGKLSAVAIRADLGDKGVYYRIEAGPVADPSTADRVCGELRQRHLACMIVR